MNTDAWARFAIRSRSRHAEFRRLAGRGATDADCVVLRTDTCRRYWYYYYDAAADALVDGELYDGPEDGHAHHMRALAWVRASG